MGLESFDIELSETSHAFDELLAWLARCAEIRVVNSESSSGTQYLLYEDGSHVLELKLMDRAHPTIHCRFALCNPPTIDAVAAAFLVKLGSLFDFKITILDDVAEGDPFVFVPATFHLFFDVLKRSV